MLKQGLADQVATAAIETAVNTLIKDKPEHSRKMSRLKGKALQVHLIELNKTLTFVFSQQIDVLAHYEAKPDCYLALHLTGLPELRDQNNITNLIKQGKIKLKGDFQLAQQFWQLMKDCKPDLEEWLSKITGDVVAHLLAQGVRDSGDWLKKRINKHQTHLAEVLTEEWKVAPGALQVAFFCEQITELSAEAETLNKRLTAFEKRLTARVERS